MEFSELIKKRQSVRHYKTGDVPDEVLLKLVEAARAAPSGKNMQNWHFVIIKRKELIEKIARAILQRNEEISSSMESRGAGADEAETTDAFQVTGTALSPDGFRKFVKNFTLFIADAPALIVVMGQTYLPSGYRELEAAGADDATLKKHAYLASPGMQSLGAAVEHLMLKATDLGYGGCWITSANYAAELIEDIVVREAGFPYRLLRDSEKNGHELLIGGNNSSFKDGWFMASLVSIGIPEDGVKSPGRKPIEQIMTFVK
ncbi:MAG: nitroreductase family protein [Clostridiales Family XIII bacterium]|jgi:nitroreductase|nr:nitroreductase family protein [Clostridiales Family XIII bacterium]